MPMCSTPRSGSDGPVMIWFSDFDYGVVGYVLRARHDDKEGKIPYPTILNLTEGRLADPGDVRFRYRMFTDRKVQEVFRVENRLAVVSARFRDLLTQFDLGSTQFFDAEIVTRKGEAVPGPFFVINVCEWKDTLVPQRASDQHREARADLHGSGARTQGGSSPGSTRRAGPLARERPAARNFFSDRLAQACRAARFRPLRLFPVETVPPRRQPFKAHARLVCSGVSVCRVYKSTTLLREKERLTLTISTVYPQRMLRSQFPLLRRPLTRLVLRSAEAPKFLGVFEGCSGRAVDYELNLEAQIGAPTAGGRAMSSRISSRTVLPGRPPQREPVTPSLPGPRGRGPRPRGSSADGGRPQARSRPRRGSRRPSRCSCRSTPRRDRGRRRPWPGAAR